MFGDESEKLGAELFPFVGAESGHGKQCLSGSRSGIGNGEQSALVQNQICGHIAGCILYLAPLRQGFYKFGMAVVGIDLTNIGFGRFLL